MACSKPLPSGSSSCSNEVQCFFENVRIPTNYTLHRRYHHKEKNGFLIDALSKPSSVNATSEEYEVVGYSTDMVPRGYYTLHFDGSYIRGARGGFAAILRRHDGKFVGAIYGCSTNVYHQNPAPRRSLLHEMEGVFHGIFLCNKMNIPLNKVFLVGDCQDALQIFEDSSCAASYGQDVVAACQGFRSEYGWEHPFNRYYAGVMHVPREANWPADCLSKFGMSCVRTYRLGEKEIEDKNLSAVLGSFLYFLDRDLRGRPIR